MADTIYTEHGPRSHTRFAGIELPELGRESETFSYALFRIGDSSLAATCTVGTPLFEMYSTSASANASTSVEPFYFKSTMTGAGGVGGRARFDLYTNVALGGWSNALKAATEYGDSGRTNGLGSAICAELSLSAGTTQGNYAPLEIELNVGTGASTGTKTAFIFMSAQGAGLATFKENGYLFILNGPTDTANGLFDATNVDAPDFTHALRIDINGTDYFIGLSTSVAFNV